MKHVLAALKNWDRDEIVQAEFWRSGFAYQRLVGDAFENYVKWSRTLPARAGADWKDGLLPGDFRIRVGDLGVVGLNTAALHLSDDFEEGSLTLGVSSEGLMGQLRSMYDDMSPSELANSIRAVIGRLMGMRAALPAGRQHGLQIATHSYFPPYSAYLFDDEELWYIPYHRTRTTLPVFVYTGRLSRLVVHDDFRKLRVEPLGGEQWNDRLASAVRDDLDDLRRQHPTLDRRLRQLQDASTRTVVFGGFVRDCIHRFVHGKRVDGTELQSRDIDVVFDGRPDLGSDGIRNHFGGMRWRPKVGSASTAGRSAPPSPLPAGSYRRPRSRTFRSRPSTDSMAAIST